MKNNTEAFEPYEEKKTTDKYEKPPKILDSLTGTVDEVDDLSESDQDLEDKEQASDFTAISKRKSKALFAVGLIVIFLSAIGLISTVRFTVSAVKDMINQTALKNEFAEFISPIVLVDAPAFNSGENLPTSLIINASIWRILLKGDIGKYENDGSNIMISEIDVESSAAALFGFGINIKHQSTMAGVNYFEYNVSSKSYNVPVDAENKTYWPRISSIRSVGETFTLEVEYMPPIMGVGEKSSPEPVKSMIYVVSRTATAMTLKSISYPQNSTEATG